jgi:hypothetical protein
LAIQSRDFGRKIHFPRGWKAEYAIDSERAVIAKKIDHPLTKSEIKNTDDYDETKMPLITAYTMDEPPNFLAMVSPAKQRYNFTIRSQVPLLPYERIPESAHSDAGLNGLGIDILLAHILTTPNHVGQYTACMARATDSYLLWRDRGRIDDRKTSGIFERCLRVKGLPPANFLTPHKEVGYQIWKRNRPEEYATWSHAHPQELAEYDAWWAQQDLAQYTN